MSVRSRSYPLLALSCVLGVGVLAAQEPEPPKPASRTTRQIEGWTVRVDNRLLAYYAQPAEQWSEALPVGNGPLGAMVFGGITPATTDHQPKSRELIRDPHFRTGFRLIEPKPGQRVVYGRLAGSAGDAGPAWILTNGQAASRWLPKHSWSRSPASAAGPTRPRR